MGTTEVFIDVCKTTEKDHSYRFYTARGNIYDLISAPNCCRVLLSILVLKIYNELAKY